MIETEQAAAAFIDELVIKNLTNEMLSVETRLANEMQVLAQAKGSSELLYAPDVYYMLAMIKKSPLCHGTGDRTALLNLVLSVHPSSLPDLSLKLLVLVKKNMGSINIYSDDAKDVESFKRIKK
jgi:hypothetical protein